MRGTPVVTSAGGALEERACFVQLSEVREHHTAPERELDVLGNCFLRALVGARRGFGFEIAAWQWKRHVPSGLELVEVAVERQQVEQENLHCGLSVCISRGG